MVTGNNALIVTKVASGDFGPFLAAVQAAADDAVQVAGTNGRTIGVGPEYITPDGYELPIYIGGIVPIMFGADANRGDKLTTNSSGQAIPVAIGSTLQNVIGVAAEQATSGGAYLMQIMIFNNAKYSSSSSSSSRSSSSSSSKSSSSSSSKSSSSRSSSSSA